VSECIFCVPPTPAKAGQVRKIAFNPDDLCQEHLERSGIRQHRESHPDGRCTTTCGCMTLEELDFVLESQQIAALTEQLAARDAELATAGATIVELRGEVERLRKRTHEIQERSDKALAPLQKDVAYLRNLMIEATHHYRDNQPELHRLKVEELIARCSEDFAKRIERYPLSAYDQATIAVLMGHLQQVREQLAAMTADRDRERHDAVKAEQCIDVLEARLADALSAVTETAHRTMPVDGSPCWCPGLVHDGRHVRWCIRIRRIIAEQPSRQGDGG
jgi:chromosome segregation ATPase